MSVRPMRLRLNLNRDWRYFRGDCPGGDAPGLDDSAWEPIGLPHTFDLPYFRTPEFFVGCGWYRRRFKVDHNWRSRRLFLEFEGAFQDATVYVNGHRVGRHLGGVRAEFVGEKRPSSG
jgi:beta-galactosidase